MLRMEQPEYKNLAELILNVVRKRPGMYLGTNSIAMLPNFILGYQFSDLISKREPDFYFGERGFLAWYEQKYQPPPMSFWHDYFLLEANDSPAEALLLYFERVEEYYNWYCS